MAQIPSQSFSPPLSSPSPSTLSPPPIFPNKRPRLSPHPTSPLHLSPRSPPALHTFALPDVDHLTNGVAAMPARTPGSMGPPSRPVDKPTDTAELTDVIAQSGINLKDEESFLTAGFSRPRYGSTAVSALEVPPNGPTPGSGTGPVLPSYTKLQQYLQSHQGHPTGGGSFGQRLGYQGTTEQLQEELRKEAVYRRRQSEVHHLNNPFLDAHLIRSLIIKKCTSHALQLLDDGMGQASDQAPQRKLSNIVSDPDGHLLVGETEAIIARDSPLGNFLALISLATAERMRGLLEAASALAVNRRASSGGVVPPEWTSLALNTSGQPAGDGAVQGSKSRATSVASPATNPRKRSFSAANLPTPVSEKAQSTLSSISFPNELAKTLRTFAATERNVEEARLAKRAKRTNPASATSNKQSPVTPGTPGSAATPGLLGERAPEVPQKKLTKKEQAKLANVKLDEAQQHRASNNTASFMLGGGGSRFGKKGKYDWMNMGAGGSGSSTPGRVGPGGIGSNIPEPLSAGTSGPGNLTLPGGRRFGEWREDHEQGMGVQLRDWIRVLRADGHETRRLGNALNKLQ